MLPDQKVCTVDINLLLVTNGSFNAKGKTTEKEQYLTTGYMTDDGDKDKGKLTAVYFFFWK